MRSLSDRAPMLALAGLLVCCSFLASCDRDPIAPATPPGPPTAPGGDVLGLVQVTISGIGSGDMHASAAAVGGAALGAPANGVSFDLTPVPGADGSIQLAPLSTGGFTEGERGNGGERYLYATFKVRNATSSGTAYTTPRLNLTFLAVSTPSTIEGTAISKMNKFDGSAADPAIALHVLPTGAVHQVSGQRASTEPDVLQVLTEAEAASFTAPPSVTTVFPYGFVVRNPLEPRRLLLANPRPGQFDGLVTFAFRIPLQASPSDDPFTVSALFVAVDDGQARLTQSLEEQNPAGEAALASRAQAIPASEVTLLPGGSYTGTIASRRVCRVRTAGPVSAPTAMLVNTTDATFQSLSPNPYATDGSGSFLASPTQFTATFSAPVGTPTAESFVVNGSESGRHFLGESYSGGGTSTVTSPSGTFFPGEEVEVVVTGDLQGCGAPTVAQFHARAPTPSTGPSSAGQSYDVGDDVGDGVGAFAVGDLNRDGALDVATANANANTIAVLLNGGDGTLQSHVDYATGANPVAVATGDLNGDGALDLVTANYGSGAVSVLLGRGDGTFPSHTEYTTAYGPRRIAIGDLNGDGRADLVVAADVDGLTQKQSAVSVLLGNGDGTFRPHTDYVTAWGAWDVRLADLNGDGTLDVVTANPQDWLTHDAATNAISVLLGNGDGTLQSHVEYATGPSNSPNGVEDVAVGDLNGDGIPDLVTADHSAEQMHVSVLLGKGDDTFQSHREYPTGGDIGVFHGIAVADLNGDGKLDVVVTNQGMGSTPYGSLDILFGAGDGSLPTNTHLSADIPTPLSVATGDLNGDGKLDLIFTGHSTTRGVVATRMNQ